MKLFFTKANLLGTVAKYAVLQSPYHRPDNLEAVLDKLNENITNDFKATPIGVLEFEDHESALAYLRAVLRDVPEYTRWNERKNGNQAPYKINSRYDTDDNPDDDFIDLDALEGNVVRELELETRQLNI